jgi:hypothetical protein
MSNEDEASVSPDSYFNTSPQFRSRVSAPEVAVGSYTLRRAFRRLIHAETNCRAFVYILWR